ncbi:RDD family protein [Streptomyces phaeoluteigriseus]|uniref:RDD family protein n=1 Tax=Streptomyces phaeoluteigriseus TaxID=114686 RepID=A0ABY4ZHK8_9ACTN|nr:RDD family protein [Streptomyces phaeoluteigriseus]USQ88589.1 RDD family protein [Streptomyces phaeoluteigriseus]
MSAPTPAPGDDRPREGYYPDPSIPGYVRYWNGASWVPGTSRPAPSDGAPLAPPGASPAPAPASVEETGPHFFDEDPRQYGGDPEPASAWGADRSRQSGFGGEQDRRVSWGGPPTPDPRTAPPEAAPDATFMSRRPTTGPAPTDEGTMTFRPPSPRTPEQQGYGPQGPVGVGGVGGSAEGAGSAGPGAGAFGPAAPMPEGQSPAGFGAGKAAADRAAEAQTRMPAQGTPGGPQATSAQGAPQASQAPQVPQAVAGPQSPQAAAPAQAAQAQPQAAHAQSAPSASPRPAPGLPEQAGGPQAAGAAGAAGGGAPMAPGPGGGQHSWAQQVHQLAGAGDDQPVVPWKPPVEDVFQAAARRQSEARPAGLGRRLGARLVDTLVLAAVTGAAAVPLGLKAVEHVNDKIDAAKLTGETVTVWLLDGTTSVYLGVVLAVLVLFGVVYEALPTAKWGRTLGKKLFGLEVRDIEGHQPPSFGHALRRWLVYSVPGLLAIGLVGILWGLFDRPWRQCWHDKAAHTFVAG